MIKEIKSDEPISVDGLLTSIDVIRADTRADVIDLIDRHLWNYSHEVWEDFKPILEQLKKHNNDNYEDVKDDM